MKASKRIMVIFLAAVLLLSCAPVYATEEEPTEALLENETLIEESVDDVAAPEKSDKEPIAEEEPTEAPIEKENSLKAPASDINASGVYDGVPYRITSDYDLIIGEEGQEYTFDYREDRQPEDYPWFYSCVKTVRAEGKVFANGSLAFMFYDRYDITSMDLSNFDTSNATDMSYMFYKCDDITSMDLSNFDTSNVTDMSYMFYDCGSLTSLDISNFDTRKVTDMSNMFCWCSSLTSLDISSFVTSNVTDMSSMFACCLGLGSLDVSNFNTSKVTNMHGMFLGCEGLTSIDLSSFDASNVTDMGCFFDYYDEDFAGGGILINLKKIKTGKGFNTATIPNGKNETYYKAVFPVYMYDAATGKAYKTYDAIPSNNYKTYVSDIGQIEPARKVEISSSTLKIAVGKTHTLKASGPADIAFKTSNKAIATVSASGKITAKKPGSATITAYSKADKTNKATCKVTVKYKLTYNMDGGKNSSKNLTWYTGLFTLKKPQERTGYDFKGWYSNDNKRVRTVWNVNKTLNAKWDPHSYFIDFLKNGGTGKNYTHIYRYGKQFTLPDCKFTRKGYNFRGWNTKADGSGKVYLDKATFKNLTSVDGKTIKFYAQWKTKKYTIKYTGLPAGAKNDNKTTYTILTKVELNNASCKGYDFTGWYLDGKKIKTIEKGSTGNKTIRSDWKAHEYTIKFDANGGTGKMSDLSCIYGEEKTLTKNVFRKNGYIFAGWNTKADGSGTAYKDAAKVKNLVIKDGGSKTLFAQWSNKYTLYWPVRKNGKNITSLSRSCYYHYTYKDGDKIKVWDHKGLDINNSDGATWYAAYSGTIDKVYTGCVTNMHGDHHANCHPNHGYWKYNGKYYCNEGLGNGIVIRTEPINDVVYYIQYAHMDTVCFNESDEGKHIEAGTELGTVGDRGLSDGIHAHFEINKNKLFGEVVDCDPAHKEAGYTYVDNVQYYYDKCIFQYYYDWK